MSIKLTNTQLVILSAAAQREDRCLILPGLLARPHRQRRRDRGASQGRRAADAHVLRLRGSAEHPAAIWARRVAQARKRSLSRDAIGLHLGLALGPRPIVERRSFAGRRFRRRRAARRPADRAASRRESADVLRLRRAALRLSRPAREECGEHRRPADGACRRRVRFFADSAAPDLPTSLPAAIVRTALSHCRAKSARGLRLTDF